MEILYLKENILYDRAGNKYDVTDINSVKRLKRKHVIILADIENIRESIVTVPSSVKSKPKQIMKHEAFNISEEESIERFEKNYMYRWRQIGTLDGNSVYLLFVVPRSEIAPQLILLKKRLKIKDVFCVNDVFGKYCQDISNGESGHFAFITNEYVHYAAVENGIYRFGRRFNIADTPQVGGISRKEELILELKRSIFYAKQKYKFTSTNLKIIRYNSSDEENYTTELEELGMDKISVSSIDKITGIAPYDLFLSVYPSILPLTSFLLDEFLEERTAQRISQTLSLVLLIIFILSALRIFRLYDEYNRSVDRYSHASVTFIKEELEKIAYKHEIETLQKLRVEYNESKKIESQKPHLIYYLRVFQFVIPQDAHINTLELAPETNGEYSAELSMTADSRNIKERIKAIQNIESVLSDSPVVAGNIKVNSDTLLKNGGFTLWLNLKKVVQKTSD